MIKEAIDRILSLAQVQQIGFNEREYTSKQLFRVPEPSPPVLEVNTLRGLVDYLESEFDRDEIGTFCDNQGAPTVPAIALHILSPRHVVAFKPIEGPWKERNLIVSATWDRQPFPFGFWLSQEDFVIKLQAMFQPSESWRPVMDIAGRIVCEDQAELHDDGIAQAVTVSKGIRKQSGIILPNPVRLKPVRTFTEVEQPESAFVFRMRPDPVALSIHEADMGAWEMVAKENIRSYLAAALPDVPIFM